MTNAGDLAIDLAEAALEGTNAVSGALARVVGSASAGDDKGEHGESELTELTSLATWRRKAQALALRARNVLAAPQARWGAASHCRALRGHTPN
jgi:hypothetical protein